MPRGKASKKSKLQSSAASQNALTTRLIQISLKTDDHIYYGKHISPSAAKEYLQEITCLKQKCARTNLHALQVIEKLLRIMKTIITEDQDLHVNVFKNQDVQVDTGFLRTSSPVYSLPDEDRSENFTDIPVIDISDDLNATAIRQEKIIDVFNALSNMAIRDEFVIETQAMIEHGNYTDIPIIDITEDSDVTTIIQQEKTIKNIYNATPNIAIQNETQAMFEEDDCSQSILDNFHDNNAGRNEILQIENNAIANPSDLNYFVAKTQHLNEISLNYNGVRTNAVVEHPQCIVIEPQKNTKGPLSFAICELKETELVKNIALVNSLTGIQITNKDSDTYNLKTLVAQPTVSKSNTSFNGIRSNKVEGTEPQPKEKKKRARKNLNNDNKERKKRTPKTKVHINETGDNSIKPQPKRKGSKTKSLNESHKKNTDENKSVVEIYNSNIENDLSWVENLRFVREISPEENDPALTIDGENFWDTFSLPNNWNDLDFDS